jgi:hypothetical protein
MLFIAMILGRIYIGALGWEDGDDPAIIGEAAFKSLIKS